MKCHYNIFILNNNLYQQLTNFTDLEANLISLSDLKKEESNKKGDSKNKDFNQSPNQ